MTLAARTVGTTRTPRDATSVRAETRRKLTALKPLVNVIAAMFGPHLEVVLHDLRNPKHSIVAIANGHVTGRRVGGPIVGGPFHDKAFRLLHEPGKDTRALVNYTTTTRDGRELKSATIVYYSPITGRPTVSLCLNFDLTSFQAARSALDAFLTTDGLIDVKSDRQPSPRNNLDLSTMIRATVDQVIKSIGKPVALMDKSEKSALVAALDETGVFMIRGSAERVARSLGISRFTVYNYLKEARRGRARGKFSRVSTGRAGRI